MKAKHATEHAYHSPRPGLAGYRRGARTKTHTTPQHPSKVWHIESRIRTQANTPQTSARIGGLKTKPVPKCARPSREWRRTGTQGTHQHVHPGIQARNGGDESTTRAQTHAPPAPARIGGGEPKPATKHTHSKPQPGLAGYRRSTHTDNHTPTHPSQDWRGLTKPEPRRTHRKTQPDWRGKAKTRNQGHTPQALAGIGRLEADRALKHTQPDTPATSGGGKAKPVSRHTHHKPPAGLAWRSQNMYGNTHTVDPSQDLRGCRETHTQTHALHNSSKPSIHNPGTKAARAMQLKGPNLTWSPGGGLHPKAFAALGLELECATPKHLGTEEPRPRRWYALGTGYAWKSGEPLGFRQKEGTCASMGAHPPGVTRSSELLAISPPSVAGSALLWPSSQVYRDVSRLPSSCAEPLPVRHRDYARRNHGDALHDIVHLPTNLPTYPPSIDHSYIALLGPACVKNWEQKSKTPAQPTKACKFGKYYPTVAFYNQTHFYWTRH